MFRVGASLPIAAIMVLGFFADATAAQSARKKPKTYPLWNFDEQGSTCRAKGRLQDRDYCRSHLMDRIVADGKDAIPILISQLRQTRATKEPIFDFWTETTAGDIANFILTDLFTDAEWKTFNMPGITSPYENCNENAANCWRAFVKKHGRQFVQAEWRAAWEKNKERISWDEQARCFKLSPGLKTN